MTVPYFSKSQLTKHLIILVMIFQFAACSTEDNVDGSGSSSGVNGISSTTSLSWVAPVERDDGTGLSLSEIAGYRIYYGTTQGVYPDYVDISDGSAVQATLNNLERGVYYVVLTTIDTEGLESSYSSEVVKTI